MSRYNDNIQNNRTNRALLVSGTAVRSELVNAVLSFITSSSN